MTSSRRVALAAATLLAAAAIFGAWLALMDLGAQAALDVWKRSRALPIAAMALFMIGQVFVSAVRWRMADGALCGHAPPLARALQSGIIAMIAGQFAPAPLVGPIVRGCANWLGERDGFKRGAVSSIYDQAFDLFVAALMLVPAATAVASGRPELFFPGTLVAALVGWALIPVAAVVVRRLGRALPAGAIHPPVSALARSVSMLVDPRLLAWLYVLSLVKFACLCAITILVARAVGFGIEPAVLAAAVPFLTIACAVALMPAGLGVTEWGFTAILAGQGVALEDAIFYALANRMILTTLCLGGMPLLALAWRIPLRGTAVPRALPQRS